MDTDCGRSYHFSPIAKGPTQPWFLPVPGLVVHCFFGSKNYISISVCLTTDSSPFPPPPCKPVRGGGGGSK